MIIKPLNEADRACLAQYGLDAADYALAARHCFASGEYLSPFGEGLAYVYFVRAGKAKVLLGLSDGKEMLLAYFISHGIIGDIELMTDAVPSYQTTLQAVTPLECIALPLQEYRTALKSNITFINQIGCELAEKLQQRALNGAINTLQSLEARLCAYISQTARGDIFDETLTEVATVMGASYRHLLRCINSLCAAGMIKKHGRQYRITDRTALTLTAGDLYAAYATT